MKKRVESLLPPGLLACALLGGCGGESKPAESVPLPAPQIYEWGGQPIAISDPPDGWRREKTQQGGLRGARFIKSGSVGEEIRFAEHFALDDRDRCARLRNLLEKFETLPQREFQILLHKARLYAKPPIHRQEADQADIANAELDRARMAFHSEDMMEVGETLNDALRQAKKIRYDLDDVLQRVLFNPKEYDSFGRVEVEAPVEFSLDGQPSVSVEFTLDSRNRKVLFHGKQVYVLKNNRLFVLAFLGLPENMPLFERIVQSVSFPPGACEH